MTRSLFRGPRATTAAAAACTHDARNACVVVTFEAAGLGVASELVLNATARCPQHVLPVFCTGGGFELQLDNASWVAVTSVSVDSRGTSVALQVPSSTNRTAAATVAGARPREDGETASAAGTGARRVGERAGAAAAGAAAAAAVVTRVRYSYADWPVVTLLAGDGNDRSMMFPIEGFVLTVTH